VKGASCWAARWRSDGFPAPGMAGHRAGSQPSADRAHAVPGGEELAQAATPRPMPRVPAATAAPGAGETVPSRHPLTGPCLRRDTEPRRHRSAAITAEEHPRPHAAEHPTVSLVKHPGLEVPLTRPAAAIRTLPAGITFTHRCCARHRPQRAFPSPFAENRQNCYTSGFVFFSPCPCSS